MTDQPVSAHGSAASPAFGYARDVPLPGDSSLIAAALKEIDRIEGEGRYFGPSASAFLYDRLTKERHDGGRMWSDALALIDREAGVLMVDKAGNPLDEDGEPYHPPYEVWEAVGEEYRKVGGTRTQKFSVAEGLADSHRHVVRPGAAVRIVDANGRVIRDYPGEALPVPPPSGSETRRTDYARERVNVDKTSTGKYSISTTVEVLDRALFLTEEDQDRWTARRLAALDAIARAEVARREEADARG